MYTYLVERKADGKKFVMLGDLKDCNIGSGRYLYDIVSSDRKYAKETSYGLRSNISTGVKYNARQCRIVHCTKVS